MLISKLLSQLVTALVSFAVGTGIVMTVRSLFAPSEKSTIEKSLATGRRPAGTNLSGVYYVAPSILSSLSRECLDRAVIRPMGFDSFLQTHQMPGIGRSMRDGRWLLLETETLDGTSYEFVGIIAIENRDVVIGKLVRLTNGEISGNADAVYYNAACTNN